MDCCACAGIITVGGATNGAIGVAAFTLTVLFGSSPGKILFGGCLHLRLGGGG